MILSDGKIGCNYIVEDIQLETNVKRRLQMLGVTKGTGIEMLNRKKNGAVILKVRGTRFAIGKKIAKGIMVEGDVI